MVGYWAELNIFGGVVLFDRGPEEGSKLVRPLCMDFLAVTIERVLTFKISSVNIVQGCIYPST